MTKPRVADDFDTINANARRQELKEEQLGIFGVPQMEGEQKEETNIDKLLAFVDTLKVGDKIRYDFHNFNGKSRKGMETEALSNNDIRSIRQYVKDDIVTHIEVVVK